MVRTGVFQNIVSLIDRGRPEELRLFRKWIKNFFYGNDEISDTIESSIIEIEEVKDMLSTTLKKRDKIQFQQGLKQGLEKGVQQGLEKGVQQGLEKGVQQGLEKGVQQGLELGMLKLRNTAKALLSKNMPIKEISDITGLSVEEIKNLK